MSESTRKKIGEKSKSKFNRPGYMDSFRKVMEERGHWVPLEQKDDYGFYFDLADWDEFALRNLDEDSRNLFYSNTKRYVRDHKFGRAAGFEFGVFPEILKHPVNCQILSRGENARKSRVNELDSVITINELFGAIGEYDLPYNDHDLCLFLIFCYQNGARYRREDYEYE